ncbi:MAG: transketolase [Actinomycetota bacterium]|nr:transketolase [Actinomycetota bacterium]
MTSSQQLSAETDAQVVSIIRGLAMDAPLFAKSGHQGTAMALAPLAHVLYSRVMRHAPQDADWRNRDRFILSNGHASILQYAALFLNGYGLEMEDIKAFRQWDSLTPGHPEVGHTRGVEVTTGPLGQGFANAVGMAIAERNLRERFGSDLMNHHTYVLAGDGCFMEGISHEAASLAGHLGLDRLVCIFDDNGITIDGSTSLTCSDDVRQRFSSYGWNVIEAGNISEDLDALESMLYTARNNRGQPTLCILKTQIGFPSPDFTDAHEAHGNPFLAEHVERTKLVMGIPNDPFWAPDSVVRESREHAIARGNTWLAEYATSTADDTQRLAFDACWSVPDSNAISHAMPVFAQDSTLATRQAIQQCIEASVSTLPGLIIGSADLTGNTGVKVKAVGGQSRQLPSGQQVYFGIREHAMGAAMLGMALHGGTIPVGGTFFVFADYMRPAIRLAALSRARVIFVFTHDSVGVGEDGPTHQPVEHLASLRVIPGLQVIRPADSNETKVAWECALTHDGPTCLVLSRQSLPISTDGDAVRYGAKTIIKRNQPDVVLVATGSEVSVCIAAASALKELGCQADVVSMPSFDRFESQPIKYQHEVFPSGVPVVSVEAGVTFGWSEYADASIGIDRFGASAPGATVMEKLGISVNNVVQVAHGIATKR